MTEAKGQFTVFSQNGFQGNVTKKYENLSLQEFINAVAREYPRVYVTWAPELTNYYVKGAKTVSALRAESIAAGRVIKLIDGKYVPFGGECYVTPSTMAPSDTPLKSVEEIEAEPLRDPLTWAYSKPFDPFEGFLSRTINPNWSAPDSGKFADRRKDSPQVNPGHALAAVRQLVR